jgi:hypothetical protein
MPTAAYDQIADWYEHESLGRRASGKLREADDPPASIVRWLTF